MDVFQLRREVVDEYQAYTNSFLHILDSDIETFVAKNLAKGTLWPEALVQLSPAYQADLTVADLVKTGVLHSTCAAIFQNTHGPLKLYTHQRQAINLAQAEKHFVVTTGTGSGKSLTYMLPIVDHVLKHAPETGKVRAIVVYPMNALINSQAEALTSFLGRVPADQQSVTFARYTGQESAEEKKAIQANPPHILLTNYVMLELMLTRPDEFTFIDQRSALQFVVLDELHTYRGRQGADVAMLMRRLKQRCGNPDLLYIGTSATMASDPDEDVRKKAVAQVASRLFGVTVPPEHVIEESLERSISSFETFNQATLSQILRQPVPTSMSIDEFIHHPLAAWIEATYSIDDQNRRAHPITLADGAKQLNELTGVEYDQCFAVLKGFFQLGSQIKDANDKAVFAFKLHQFISQGGAVYATLAKDRQLSLQGQQYIASCDANQDELLYPLLFCRECGQEYYMCAYNTQAASLVPRPPVTRSESGSELGETGYAVVGDDIWHTDREEELPDSWFKQLKRGREPKKEFKDYIPRQLWVEADGTVRDSASATATQCWFMPTPFLSCLCCGVVYTRRDKNDFAKLARLSSESRSTATTLLSLAAIRHMRSLAADELAPDAQKLLSFTDNRQDASLQAGHLNDFVSVALLRSAMYQALTQAARDGEVLTYLTIAEQVTTALNLTYTDFSTKPETTSLSRQLRYREPLVKYIEYRIYEDLRRSWRITQPNLEQCGLVMIDYAGLSEECENETLWQAHPVLRDSSPEQRETTIRAVLDYMRRELALNVGFFDIQQQASLVKLVENNLKDPWKFESDYQLRVASRFVLPKPRDENDTKKSRSQHANSLSARSSTLGRFLRSPKAWPTLEESLSPDEGTHLINVLLDILLDIGILSELLDDPDAAFNLRPPVQIDHTVLEWRLADLDTLAPDLIRSQRMSSSKQQQRPVNQFFKHFYRDQAAMLQGVVGREHTGQVTQADREQREEMFRDGTLPLLFCSPTMELGIDIADLNMVHMRNVPPTPANYAQRSGRAGRSGQPAFVATYCAMSGHDQYFFQRPEAMVSGVVAPPQIELANEDLVRAHVHAVWLGMLNLALGKSMTDILDLTVLTQPHALPLQTEFKDQLQLSDEQVAQCFEMCKRIVESARSGPHSTEHDLAWSWYSDEWLFNEITKAQDALDQACERWRTLYLEADQQIHDNRLIIDSTAPQQERKAADRREAEAKRQKDLLKQEGSQTASEFYPYRYLASEGFLPGYNFPRLPVRAFLPTSQKGAFLARPRFLAIAEFGPLNVIYHEGRKYRVARTQFKDAQSSFVQAKMCTVCGYFYEQADFDASVCQECGTRFNHENVRRIPLLLEMPTQMTYQIERINCEEEERIRQGYTINTYYRFAHDAQQERRQMVQVAHDDQLLLQLVYGPQATVLRVNHGWRRGKPFEGFVLNQADYSWRRGDESATDSDNGADSGQAFTNVHISVRDTRNILVFEPSELFVQDYTSLVSLQYALQRGIQEVFQLEEQELASEVLSQQAPFRLLFWEATEGGAGVLRRLVEEPDALKCVAAKALEICHFDPATGTELTTLADGCVRACYRCLLSYANQYVHLQLNRHEVRDPLLDLAAATITYQSLALPELDLTDATPFARQLYALLQADNRCLPDTLLPTDAAGVTVFRFGSAQAVLCADPGVELLDVIDQLELAGYLVKVLHADQDLATQVQALTFL